MGLLAGGLLTIAGCGDNGGCGKGTYRDGHTCRPGKPGAPVVTVDPPAGRTREVGNVTLRSSEPAEIYYTTDGSEPTTSSAHEPDQVLIPGVPDDGVVKYFAIDRTGKASEVGTATWIIDRVGPAVPSLDLVRSGADRTVTWTKPPEPDLVAIVVARVEGRPVSPVPGATYAVGDEIGPGVTVVAVSGDAGEVSESLPATPGLVRYAAWGLDDVGNYGPAAADWELVPIATQTATFSASAANGVVVVNAPPSLHGLSGTAEYDAGGGALDVTLTFENRSTRTLFAPKLVVLSLSTGSFDDDDGTLPSGDPFRSLGAVALPGVAITRSLRIGGIGPTDVVTVSARLDDNPLLAAVFWQNNRSGITIDPVGGVSLGEWVSPGAIARGYSGELSLRGGGITPDGTFLAGARNAGRLTRFDLSTGEPVDGVTLAGQKSNLSRVVLDPAGARAYALVASGHRIRGGSNTWLVRLDAASLAEAGRIELGRSRNRDLEISPDGRLLAVATGTDSVIFVDLVGWRIAAKVHSATPAFGGGPPYGAGAIEAITFSADGSILYGVSAIGNLVSIDTAQFALYPIGMATANDRVFGLGIGADGRLWIGRDNRVQAFDLGDGSVETFGFEGSSFVVIDGFVYAGGSTIFRLDMTGSSDFSLDPGASVRGHWLGASPF